MYDVKYNGCLNNGISLEYLSSIISFVDEMDFIEKKTIMMNRHGTKYRNVIVDNQILTTKKQRNIEIILRLNPSRS
jgi:hypothetical protein